MVKMLQKHRHSSYCRINGRCQRALICEPPESENPNAGLNDEQTSMLAKVHQIPSEAKECDLTLDETLSKANVDKVLYHQALQISTKGAMIVLKRQPRDSCVNNYNPVCLRAWKASIDIQFVLNAYACIMYVASYMMKAEKSMGQLLKQVAEEHRLENQTKQSRSSIFDS